MLRTGRFSNLIPLSVMALMTVTGVGGGCITVKDPTLLNPAGPPDLKQVLVTERLSDGTDTDLQITYGTHPDILDGAANKVMTGVVTKGSQQMHVVFDELLDGKTVEQFECACTSNCPAGHDWSIDAFDCSICGDDSGTPVNEAGHCLDAVGGISDGLPDVSELQPGRAHINCASPTPFTYDVGPGDGFYNPSGNQLIPFGEGPAGLGPSLILTPNTYLPTNVDCTITIDAGAKGVKDKDGNTVPATEVPSFHTEPLVLVGSAPQDNTSGIDASAAGFKISLSLNSFVLESAAVSGITVQDTTASATVPGSVALDPADPTTAIFTPTATLASGDTFVVTLSTAVTDQFGDPLPVATTVTFTTK